MCFLPMDRPVQVALTGSGVALFAIVPPLPSCPRSLRPQQKRSPPDCVAQVWSPPHTMVSQVAGRELGRVRVLRSCLGDRAGRRRCCPSKRGYPTGGHKYDCRRHRFSTILPREQRAPAALTISSHAVAKLPPGVVTPAIQVVATQPTGVLEAGGDCAPVHVRSNAGRDVAVPGRAITELPLGIPSPAIQRTLPDGAGVIAARCERSPIFAGAHSLRGQERGSLPSPLPSCPCSSLPQQ